MAIPGQEQINVSNTENQASNSDSLFTAFHKIQNNFTTLFGAASPFNTFRAGSGISANADAPNSTITFTNTGVTSLTAGAGIVLANSNGAYTIAALGGNGATGVANVNIISNSLSITGNAASGLYRIDIPTIATGPSFATGTYVSPTITVDKWGKITEISNTVGVGTVTSVSVAAGPGMVVYGGTVTDSGTITVTNTGVHSVKTGTGLISSSSTGNGDITLAIDPSYTSGVTSVGVTSNSLVVSGGPITSDGSINIELPEEFSIGGNLSLDSMSTAQNVFVGNVLSVSGPATFSSNISSGNANLGNLVTANYFAGDGSTLTAINGANVSGQVSNSLISGTVYTNAQPNITSVGTLSNLTVSGTITTESLKIDVIKDSIGTNTLSFSSGDVSTAGDLTVGLLGIGNITSGNASLGNLVTANYFSGIGSLLDSINGANVTGVVGNANIANFSYGVDAANVIGQVASSFVSGTVLNNAQPNITSIGTLSELTVDGITTLGANANVKIDGGAGGQVLTTDGAGNLTWSTVAGVGSGAYDGALVVAISNVANSTSTNSGALQVAGGVGVIGNIYVGGKINATNVTDANTSLGGAAAGALIVTGGAHVTKNLNVGNGIITGNILVTKISVTTVDMYGNISWNANAAVRNSANVVDIFSNGAGSSQLNYANLNRAFTDTSGFGIEVKANSTATAKNFRLYANGESTLPGGITLAANSNITLSNSLSQIAGANLVSANYIAGTLTTKVQPNITSVGTLVNTVVGAANSITGGNLVSANYFTGTLTTGAQPNITSVGNLVLANVTGNIRSNNLSVTSNITSANATISNFLTIANTGDLLFNTVSDNTKGVVLQAPASIAGSTGTYIVWELPNTIGNTNQFLTTDGSGSMQWKTIASSSAPSTASSVGTQGTIAFDATHIYVCIAANSWIRANAAGW